MATVDVQGTNFSLSFLPQEAKNAFRIKMSVTLKNEWLSYADEGEYLTAEEGEELVSALSRLLAGGYRQEKNLVFERAGLAVDLYPYEEAGKLLSRESLRQKDCVAAVRLLLRSKDKSRLLGGVYTLLLHRQALEGFVAALREEYLQNCIQRIHGTGEYAFVGVSPLGYKGCNYYYFDPSNTVCAGEYVWLRMGRHNRLQIAYVDSARRFSAEDAPFNPQTVKRVLRKATAEEVAAEQEKDGER